MSATDQREDQIRREMSGCVHFTGIQNETCKAGVNIRQLVGGPALGWGARMPCLLRKDSTCEVTCPSRQFPTREEAEKSVADGEASMEIFLKAAKAAHVHARGKGLGRGNGGRGEMPCPAEGCGGVLRYVVASVNGHMHAACTTKGCISWME